jgi:hypothetical protein
MTGFQILRLTCFLSEQNLPKFPQAQLEVVFKGTLGGCWIVGVGGLSVGVGVW